MRCYHNVTTLGGLRVELDFTPADLRRMEKLIRTLLRETTRALKLASSIETDRIMQTAIEADSVRDCRARQRMALSVIARTGSAAAAAKASGLQVSHVRIVASLALAQKRLLARQARNQSIAAAVAAGTPRGEIANRHGLHVKSIPRIVRESRRAGVTAPVKGIR